MEDMQTDSNSQLETMHETQQNEKRSQTVAAEEKAGYCYW